MKKITYSLLLSFLATFIFLSSCKKKEVEEVVKPAPTLSFIGGQGMTSNTVTVTPGSVVKVGLNTGAAGDNLSTLAINRNGVATSEFNGGVMSKKITGSSYSETINFIAPDAPETYTYNFIVTTTDNKTASLSLVVIVKKQIGGAISSFNSITLGAQTNTPKPGFLNLMEQKIYSAAEAKSNPAMIDMIYIYNDAEALFVSPSSGTAPQAYSDIQTWAVKNETLFQATSVTPSEFDKITGDPEIFLAYDGASGFAKEISKPLTNNSVIGFKTKNDKKGLIKITNITTGVNGSITFDVKVQK